jgi:prepilin-type processing-associated H-X9-DG protein
MLRSKTELEARRCGESLIEVLIVIAIIGVLIGLLLAAVMHTTHSSYRLSCTNNLKQIGLALQSYHFQYNSYPWGVRSHQQVWPNTPDPGYLDWAWPARLLPFIEQETLFSRMDMRPGVGAGQFGPYANPGNREAMATTVPNFLCPSDPEKKLDSIGTGGVQVQLFPAKTNYVGVADSQNRWRDKRYADPLDRDFQPDVSLKGNGMLFNHTLENGPGVRLTDVRDGASNTLFVGEGTGGEVAPGQILGFTWAEVAVADTKAGINGPGSVPGGDKFWYFGSGFSSYHSGGANFLFVDGTVHFLPKSIDQTLLEALATRNGREAVTLPWAH